MATGPSQLLASLAEAERALANAKPRGPMSAFDMFAASLKRQYNIRDDSANLDKVMQLVTEAWHNLAATERAPFDSRAREDMQRYLEEQRVYDQMQMRYSQLKQEAQASRLLAGGTAAAAAAPPQQQGGAALASSLINAYSQAVAAANSRQQQQQQQQQQPAQPPAAQPPRGTAAYATAQQVIQQIAQQAQHAYQAQQAAAQPRWPPQQPQTYPGYGTPQQQPAAAPWGAAPSGYPQHGNYPPPAAPPAPQQQQQQGYGPSAAAAMVAALTQRVAAAAAAADQQRRPAAPQTVEVTCYGVNGTLVLSEQCIVCRCSGCSGQPIARRSWTCGQFEIHASAGSGRRWRQAVSVRPGTVPEAPLGGPLLAVGRWLELRGIDVGKQTLQPFNTEVPVSPDARIPAELGRQTGGRGGGGGGRGGRAAAYASPASHPGVYEPVPRAWRQPAPAAAPPPPPPPSKPWRDAGAGRFSPVAVRWSGERCSVCDADTDYDADQLVTCDGCGITVHQSCYGVAEVPGTEAMWLCRACELREEGRPAPQCCLCPVAGGALKPTTIAGVWCHAACLQWVPEVTVDDVDAMEPVTGIRSIPRERWELLCALCKQRLGAKIQCSSPSCYTAYHPLCARIAGYHMEIVEEAAGRGRRHGGGDDADVTCVSYCARHAKPQPHLSGVRKVLESERGGDLPDALPRPRLWNAQPYPLPRPLPLPRCPAGCARGMALGPPWVRRQHGTGTGATTEAGFWIPELGGGSEDGASEGGGGSEDGAGLGVTEPSVKDEGVEEAGAGGAALGGGGGEAPEGHAVEAAEPAVKRSSRPRSKLSNSTGSEKATSGAEPAQNGNGACAFPATAPAAADLTASPPAVAVALRPAAKRASSTDGERPPAKLRRLNSLHAAKGKAGAALAAAAAAAPPAPSQAALVAGRAPAALVGAWVRVWWPEDREWYVGAVREYSASRGMFRVWYEVDSEAEWIDLGREDRNGRVQALPAGERAGWPPPPPPPDGEGAAAAAPRPPQLPPRQSRAQERQGTAAAAAAAAGGPAEGAAAVGRRLGVFRDEDGRFFYGTVRSYRPDLGHMVAYDRGEVDWVDLKSSRVDWSGGGAAPQRAGSGGVEARAVSADAPAAQQPRGPRAVPLPEAVPVVCNGVRGTFNPHRLTITVARTGKEVSPGEFERQAGRGVARKWRVTIRLDKGGGAPGRTLEAWMVEERLEEAKPAPPPEAAHRRAAAARGGGGGGAARPGGASGLRSRSTHLSSCQCVICKQARRSGKRWSGMKRRAGQKGKGAEAEAEEEEEGEEGYDAHEEGVVRSGKRAYLEALPLVVSAGPRPPALWKTPPSRCWTPAEWAAHRLRAVQARDASKSGGGAAAAGPGPAPPVVLAGGASAVVGPDNLAAAVSLGPGTAAHGRALSLKDKLDLCTATERERVTFGKSGIHGWGLFARAPIPQDAMVVEFRGELVRRAVADAREARYLAEGTDCYIFNLDDAVVLDATAAGTAARFTNHSCQPSLYTKILALNGELRLAFFAREDIAPGQELTYNYRFAAAEEGGEERLPCCCGAPNCSGFLN